MVYMELGYGRRRQELAFRMRLAVGSGRKDGESWLSVLWRVREGHRESGRAEKGSQRVIQGCGGSEGHGGPGRVMEGHRESYKVEEGHRGSGRMGNSV